MERFPAGDEISFPKFPDRMWGPCSLIFNGYWGGGGGGIGRAVQLTTHPSPRAQVKEDGGYILLPP